MVVVVDVASIPTTETRRLAKQSLGSDYGFVLNEAFECCLRKSNPMPHNGCSYCFPPFCAKTGILLKTLQDTNFLCPNQTMEEPGTLHYLMAMMLDQELVAELAEQAGQCAPGYGSEILEMETKRRGIKLPKEVEDALRKLEAVKKEKRQQAASRGTDKRKAGEGKEEVLI